MLLSHKDPLHPNMPIPHPTAAQNSPGEGLMASWFVRDAPFSKRLFEATGQLGRGEQLILMERQQEPVARVGGTPSLGVAW